MSFTIQHSRRERQAISIADRPYSTVCISIDQGGAQSAQASHPMANEQVPAPELGDVERLTGILGRPLRSCRDFAAELAAQEKKDCKDSERRVVDRTDISKKYAAKTRWY